MRTRTPVGIVLGGVIGVLAVWLLGWPGFVIAGGLAAGGVLGHLLSPPGSRVTRKDLEISSGGTGIVFLDLSGDGASGDGRSGDCDSGGGSDGGSCDGGGGGGGD
jgi:hypothetical protein